MLNVIDPEGDNCCKKELGKILQEQPELEGPWECPICWLEWTVKVENNMRVWTANVKWAMI